MTDTTSPELRALRVWHYREAQKNRELARNAVATTTGMRYLAAVSQHEGFVQKLNDFFMVGDTAERDAKK